MCEAVTGITLAAWGAIASIAGAGVGAYSAYQSGQSAKGTAEYNEEMAKRSADDALQRGASEAAEKRDRARRIISAQNAAGAANGIELNSGTQLKLNEEAAGFGELDALRTINNAQRQASGFSAESELEKYRGTTGARAGYMNAGSSLLTGAASTYSTYKALK
jgi:hypothetical protein